MSGTQPSSPIVGMVGALVVGLFIGFSVATSRCPDPVDPAPTPKVSRSMLQGSQR